MYSFNYEKKFDFELPVPEFSDRYSLLMNSDKKNVIYLKDEFDNSTFRYRTYNVIEAMKKNKKYCINCFLISELSNIYSLIDKVDIIILQRAKWSFELENFIYLAKYKKKIIIYDIDDMIYSTKYVPKYLNSISDYRENSVDAFFALAARYERIAKMCDGFIVTTDLLKKNIEKDFKKPTWILRNFLNTEQENISKEIVKQKYESYNNKKFVIGYFSGSNSHKRDLEILESAMIKLINKYDDIYLKIVGFMTLSDSLEKLKNKGKIILEDFVSYEELQYKIASVDLNVIPLQKHDFNNCKSELKYFEASIVNTLTCATDNLVYKNLISDGKDGFLCDELSWFKKIEYIYLNRDKMNKIVDKANSKCYKLYGNENQEKIIEDIYDNIIESIGDKIEK